MSVPSYEGKTYVGYLDISGFKQIMKRKQEVGMILDQFYSTLYNTVYDVNSNADSIKMNVVAVSDCAVLFLNKGPHDDVDQNSGLPKMMQFIRCVNRRFIDHDSSPFMTTCSIAYGDFRFEDKKEGEYIRKNCLRGPAYVEAYLDSEKESEKVKPGKCRILRQGLNIDLSRNEFAMLKKEKQYYYYYWMRNDPHEISLFDKEYERAYEKMYDTLKRLLRNPSLRG